MKTLYSLIESRFPADLRALYEYLGITEQRFDSARNLHRAIQKQPPDIFVGEFVYGWGNNYAGANISNLDVTLRTLQCYAPKAKLIVFHQPGEAAHIDKLLALFPIDAVFAFPLDGARLRVTLLGLMSS